MQFFALTRLLYVRVDSLEHDSFGFVALLRVCSLMCERVGNVLEQKCHFWNVVIDGLWLEIDKWKGNLFLGLMQSLCNGFALCFSDS